MAIEAPPRIAETNIGPVEQRELPSAPPLSAALSGGAMFIYSALLIVINRRVLPEPLKIRGVRLAVLAFAFCMFGVMSVLVVINEAAG